MEKDRVLYIDDVTEEFLKFMGVKHPEKYYNLLYCEKTRWAPLKGVSGVYQEDITGVGFVVSPKDIYAYNWQNPHDPLVYWVEWEDVKYAA